MKKILITALILLTSVCSAHATQTMVTVPFNYEYPADYFSLFIDGDWVCDSEAGVKDQISCNVDIDFGIRVFTVVATKSGFKSEVSKPYSVMVKPQLGRPVIFSVIFGEGESLIIQPIEIVPDLSKEANKP